MLRITLLAVVTVSVVVFGGCGDSAHTAAPDAAGAGWSAIGEGEMTQEQLAQLDRAVTAADTLAKLLMGELRGELESGGPAAAVAVCRDLAPLITSHVAEESSLRIGRTSYRLRNPQNAAPVWAAELVTARTDRPAYREGPAGELGVLLPIRLGTPCLTCHGAPETLDASVQEALAESYPDDRAVGFADGDLRGWFWVEVPVPGERSTGTD